ncbi:S41 family peptidase [Stenotrophomonas bentonitica]|uniref:S41 family peptidase n=1 Tax=Stenotrophomonas TaxID=40323 RepID=UPI000C9BF55E|nr:MULTISPECIES: S41 family peptidase [Stenotrophomonas]MDX5514419.1 S41 family peptidase [Stenotrophomonas sp. RG-453]
MATMRWMAGLLAAVGTLSASGVSAAAAVDRDAWRADYAVLKAALQSDYAHLAWMASPESGVDLPTLDARAQRDLAEARNDAQATQALRSFLAGFHDGHLALLDRLDAGGTSQPPRAVDPRTLGPSAGCAALGVADEGRQDFSLPLETLPGYTPLDGQADPALRAGILALPEGRKVGVLRLHEFDALRYPGLCHALWPQLRHADSIGDMRSVLVNGWVAMIAGSLRRFQHDGVDAVLVDVGDNPGGDDSGDTLARLFTPRPVTSATLLVSQSAAGRPYLDEQYERLDDALRRHHPAATARRLLTAERASFDASRRALSLPACDLSWVWQTQQPWNGGQCRRLVAAGTSGGPLPSQAVDTLDDFLIAHRLDWAQDLRAHWGAWDGPVYVITNGKTVSSAEMFAARMQDNRIARIVGTGSGGYGCGFMSGAPSRELPHSHLRMRIPDCVRLRADGTDEVAGIAPDLPITPRAGEGARARAQRLLETVAEDITRH